MIVQYTKKINIYNIHKMMAQGGEYSPKEFVIPTDQYEKICDYYFKPNDENDKYTCYIACKVQGAKKIKIFDIKKMHKEQTWEDESNSINFFEDMH